MPDSSADTSRTQELEAQIARLADEMGRLWRQGDCRPVEDFLTRYHLENRPEVAIPLVYEELCLRREQGQEASLQEYLARFPRWGLELGRLFFCHGLFEGRMGAPAFPDVGEVLGDFHLLAELGRGLQGRVFLATQSALADRPVVLKLTPRTGSEHLSLARLQHTYIVPLLFVQEDAVRGLLILCMPWFGGGTLAQVLAASTGGRPGAGRYFLERVDALQAASPLPWSARGPARQFLRQASAEQTACWIGACLADALHYAHEQGLVHLDVKPSNVLLTADGQPMLLDFHVACKPLRRAAPPPEWLGGTPAYMSPEQQSALAAVRAVRQLAADVDGRSDVYSLAVLLYEMLAGVRPPAGRPPLRSLNPDVSVGLSDVIDKCLAEDPAKRYGSAGALAADLRRHLADLPLHGVRNRSPLERWAKWRRRRPLNLALWGLLATVLAATAAATALLALHFAHQQDAARNALLEGRRHLQQRQYAEALARLRHGQVLIVSLPGTANLAGELTAEVRSAEQAQVADELHQLTDGLRFLYGVESMPGPGRHALEAQCRALWDRGGDIVRRLQSDTDPRRKQQVQADLLDLAILWADLRARQATDAESASARREVLETLEGAEALFGATPVLLRERQRHAAALGLADLAAVLERRAAALPPRTAWEHYALGRALLQADRPKEAYPLFTRALELDPKGLWPLFYRGLCAYRLERFQEAVMAFSACAALAPDSGGVLYNRAGALSALGCTDLALRDYDEALRLNPRLAAAALNRGTLLYRVHRHAAALRDLQRALELGAPPATVHYNLALVHLALRDRSSALASLRSALAADPHHPNASPLLQDLERQP